MAFILKASKIKQETCTLCVRPEHLRIWIEINVYLTIWCLAAICDSVFKFHVHLIFPLLMYTRFISSGTYQLKCKSSLWMLSAFFRLLDQCRVWAWQQAHNLKVGWQLFIAVCLQYRIYNVGPLPDLPSMHPFFSFWYRFGGHWNYFHSLFFSDFHTAVMLSDLRIIAI